jgi:hypothetical protein
MERAERVEFLTAELGRRRIDLEPMFYGCPDLLFPKGYDQGYFDMSTKRVVRDKLDHEETDEEYKLRQNQALYDLVTGYLTVVKDDKLIKIFLIPKMAAILGDLFFERVDKLILWANRGGGKSLLAAVFMWISFVYKRKSCLNMGGAGNQARRVYDYTKQFWHCFPGMQEGMLAREPLLTTTEMKNGSKLICSTSISTAIGEHIGLFVADEACTDRPGADMDLMRAMQGAMSEEPHTIFLLSTFHLPIGFFADVWDSAEELGFTKVTWNCFETMGECDAGLEFATEEDPQAIESFCKEECPLSWEIDTYDEFGNVTGQKWVGCLGTARESDGWQSRKMVLEEQKINQGTRIFPVEHACIRPEREGNIYNKALIEACMAPWFNLCMDRRKVVGIDWGLTQCAVVLIGEWTMENENPSLPPIEGVGLIDIVFMSNRLVDVVVEQIQSWQKRYGDDVVIRADASHPYCNTEVASHGYRVIPVKGDRLLRGEDNLARWLGSGFFKMLEGFELLITQLHNLRRNVMTGKQIKRNISGDDGDHGPDALKFAMMEYDYVKWTRKRALELEKSEQTPLEALLKKKRHAGGLDSLLFP